PTGRIEQVPTGNDKDEIKMMSPQVGYSSGWGDPDRQRLLAELHTGADGKFEVSNVVVDGGWTSQKDHVWVVVQAPGKGTEFHAVYVSNDSDGNARVDDLKFKIKAAASIRGRITNSDGEPVEGAVVSCSEFNYLAKPVPGVLTAITDADGQYAIN